MVLILIWEPNPLVTQNCKQIHDSSSQVEDREKRKSWIHSLLNGFPLGIFLHQNKINNIPMGINSSLSCPEYFPEDGEEIQV